VTGLHPFCALMFAVGFALRAYNTWDYDNLKTYIASTMFIYFAPWVPLTSKDGTC
jgi:hypothetical protein